MARYYRRYYRRYRRFSRKYRKTLKKSNIFSRKSARSQAKQIYALNKKINYIQKTTKPELQIRNYNVWYKRFLNVANQPLNADTGHVFFYEEKALSENTPDDNRIDLNGEMMRVKFIKFFGQFGVYNDSTLSGDWNVANTKTLIENDPSTAYLRIVVCRLKKGGGRVPDNIFCENPVDAGGTSYDASYIMNGPLVKNLSSQLDVIKDKKIFVDVSHPFKQFSFRLSAKKLGYYYRKKTETAPNSASGENELMIFYYYSCPALLRYVSPAGVETYIGPQAYFTLNYNIGYVDQN